MPRDEGARRWGEGRGSWNERLCYCAGPSNRCIYRLCTARNGAVDGVRRRFPRSRTPDDLFRRSPGPKRPWRPQPLPNTAPQHPAIVIVEPQIPPKWRFWGQKSNFLKSSLNGAGIIWGRFGRNKCNDLNARHSIRYSGFRGYPRFQTFFGRCLNGP